MPTTATALEPIQLSFQDGDRKVLVTPSDEDRFGLTVAEAIHACRARDHAYKFTKQFERLLVALAEWRRDNAADVKEAYLTIQDNSMLFLVVTTHTACDPDFEDKLTAFDIKIANDENFNAVNLNVMALPPVSKEGLSAFVDREFTVSIPYAD